MASLATRSRPARSISQIDIFPLAISTPEESSPKPSEVKQNWDDRESSTVYLLEAHLQRLEQLYIFRDQRVSPFLKRHPSLVWLLQQVKRRIETYFPGSQLFLQLVADPEMFEEDPEAIDSDDPEVMDKYESLVVSIATHLPPHEAVGRLMEFYKSWWLGASKHAGERIVFGPECL